MLVPPFAVITLSKIESEGLHLLAETFNIKPDIYVRYIDDIFLGSLPRDIVSFDKILDIFNFFK